MHKFSFDLESFSFKKILFLTMISIFQQIREEYSCQRKSKDYDVYNHTIS